MCVWGGPRFRATFCVNQALKPYLCHPVPPSDRTKVVVIQGDVTDYSGVLEASRGADVVIHTASLVDVWHRVPEALIHSVNVTGETAWGGSIPNHGKEKGWRGEREVNDGRFSCENVLLEETTKSQRGRGNPRLLRCDLL